VIDPIVDVDWLHGSGGDVVLADVRWYLDGRSGRAAYEAGHLPGAVFVDLDRWLAAPPSDDAGRHPLPDPAVFARGMASLGIGDGDLVVAYDDAGGVIAARLVWMLRVTGREAALLDGGITAWAGPLESGTVTRAPAAFGVRAWPPEHLASIDDAADPRLVVIDARPAARYRGGSDPVDPRSGHIPGARSLPCRDNLDANDRLLPTDELRRRFERAGVRDAASVVSYCGSGVTACLNLLVLEQVGLGRGRLFPGSWSQWSRDPSRPLAIGEDEGTPIASGREG
jgi:thiosulfate/3-mercaptopyruvate sulfurtransferase